MREGFRRELAKRTLEINTLRNRRLSMKIDRKNKIKLVALIVVVVLAVIIFLQNTEPVKTQILFLRFEMSRALLLILTFLLGLLTGVLLTTNFLKGKKNAKA